MVMDHKQISHRKLIPIDIPKAVDTWMCIPTAKVTAYIHYGYMGSFT